MTGNLNIISNTNHTGHAPLRSVKSGVKSNSYNNSSLALSEAGDDDHKAPNWSEILVRLGVHQDRQAFKRLFDHFAPLIKSYYLGKQPQSRNMIDELIQEVMLKVWQKAGTYDSSKAAASTWIFTLARNTHIDLLRRQKKYSTTSSLDAEEVWANYTEDFTEKGPLLDLEAGRDTKNIIQAMANLPKAQSQVIRKVYMEGKTHSEVSDELELPLGTVKSRVRLALNKLNSLLGEVKV